MGAAVPDVSIGDDRYMMGGPLPLPHQNGPGPSQWRCPALPGRPREHAPEQSIELTYRGFPEAAVAALLPNVGDTQRKKLAAEGSWRLLADLLLPKVPKLRT